jgi:multiple sugar transport system substrate-binding protein
VTTGFTRRALLAKGGAAIGGAVLFGTAGCGSDDGSSSSGQPSSLRVGWWGADTRHTKTTEALDAYAAKHSPLKISTEYTGDFAGYFNKLATQTAGGGAPDLFQMSGQYIAEYGQRNALLDLGQYVPDPINLSTWDKSVQEQGVIDGKTVGIAPALDAYAFLYDETKLKQFGIEPPKEKFTWSDFATLTNEVRRAAKNDKYWGSEDAGYQYEILQVFLRQRGKDLFTEDSIGYAREDIEELWDFWAQLRKTGAVVPPDLQSAAGPDAENSPIVHQQAAFEFSTSSLLANFVGLTKNQLGITMFPFAGDGAAGQVIRAGLYWCAPRTANTGDATAELIQWLVNDAEAARIMTTIRGVPASPEMRNLVKSEVDEATRRSFDYLDLATQHSQSSTPLRPFPPGFGDHRALYERLYYEVAFGRMDLKEGVDQLMKQAPSLVQK